jgi:hypothetical protein
LFLGLSRRQNPESLYPAITFAEEQLTFRFTRAHFEKFQPPSDIFTLVPNSDSPRAVYSVWLLWSVTLGLVLWDRVERLKWKPWLTVFPGGIRAKVAWWGCVQRSISEYTNHARPLCD